MKTKAGKWSMALILTGVLLAGCGNSGNNGSGSGSASGESSAAPSAGASAAASASPAAGEKVKIVFSQGADQTDGTKKLVAAFEAQHPDIDVEVREFPNDSSQMHDQLLTILSGQSSEVDVLNLDVTWPAEFAQAGFLLPLDRYIEQDGIDTNEYLKGGIQAGYYNGQQWAFPRYNNAGLLYYRTDLVKKVPTTWDELLKQAEELKGQGGTKYGFVTQGKQYEGLAVGFTELVNAYGGQIIDDQGNVVVNSPEALKGLKKLIEIQTSKAVPSNLNTFTEKETLTAFIEGDAVFARHWPALYAQANDPKVSKIVGKVGIAPLPAGDARSAAALGGWLGAISKYSKHPKEAWEFLKFLISEEGEKIVAINNTQTPTYLKLFDDPEVQKASPLFANHDFVNGLGSAVPRTITPQYAKISGLIQVEVSKAIAGQQTAEQALAQLETQIKAAVSQ
ncbi:multiple sugar transport system substrate-binding protein [Paenibacillus sophorae]|uniref:ABC transporter substrate-binding protein n=1 Tax=Paenibacillus sophorae TaxID=1333845 RepID=A0A1H8VP95_9BACL|nr:ABC transporter substrate-binding protein [Paenibacillus sophorae]QWU17581.1 ABC transporter substrate-binding protein [Paenibacillus sophorae]SEP16728.1 multiple sugar transport system substrate-binding protein [Paenibacillus sophorae]